MKTLITFLDSFAINWPVIWSDSSIYVCFWLVALCLIVIWAAKNYRNSVRDEYLVKATSARIKWDDQIDKLTRDNKFLNDAFSEYRTDAQNEAFERQERINQLETKLEASKLEYDELELKYDNVLIQLSGRRNPDGTFAKTTGKGHGRKKPAPVPEPERDWTTATPDELLAEAKRRYPVGTRVIPFNLDLMCGNPTQTIISGINYCIDTYQRKHAIWIMSGDWNSVIYSDGCWAQILP